MNSRQSLLLIIGLLICQACAKQQNITDTDENYRDVIAGKWVLARINDNDLHSSIPLPQLEISLTDMNVLGSGGCNRYAGKIAQLTANTIQLNDLSMTEMACSKKHIEDDYFKALMEINTYKVKGKYLTFYNKEGKNVLSYMKVEDHTVKQQLHDIWAAIRIGGHPINRMQAVPSLEINLTEMTILGTDGCNNYTATIKETSATTLSFGPLASTRKICPDMEIPNKFNAMMQKVSTYKLEGLNLILLDEEGKEVLRFLKVD